MPPLRSSNRYFHIKGYGTKTLKEWSDETGVKPNLILMRLERALAKLGVADLGDLDPETRAAVVQKIILTAPRAYRMKPGRRRRRRKQ